MAGRGAVAPADVMEMAEYMNWKNNVPVFYDLVMSHPLEWPSLTVQWLPSESPASARSHCLVLGPTPLTTPPATSCSSTLCSHSRRAWPQRPPPRAAPPGPTLSIGRSAPHQGEVNRTRCMSRQPYTVATKTCVNDVHVYRLGKDDEKGCTDVVLSDHGAEGYGLARSAMKEGFLLSGSYNKKICLWDLKARKGAPDLDAQQVFEISLQSQALQFRTELAKNLQQQLKLKQQLQKPLLQSTCSLQRQASAIHKRVGRTVPSSPRHAKKREETTSFSYQCSDFLDGSWNKNQCDHDEEDGLHELSKIMKLHLSHFFSQKMEVSAYIHARGKNYVPIADGSFGVYKYRDTLSHFPHFWRSPNSIALEEIRHRALLLCPVVSTYLDNKRKGTSIQGSEGTPHSSHESALKN